MFYHKCNIIILLCILFNCLIMHNKNITISKIVVNTALEVGKCVTVVCRNDIQGITNNNVKSKIKRRFCRVGETNIPRYR